MKAAHEKTDRTRGMRRTTFLAILLAAAGLTAGLTARRLFRPMEQAAPPSEQKTEIQGNLILLPQKALRRGEIQVLSVERRPLPQELRVTGRVQVNEDRAARVGSPVEGRVTRVLATVGDRVRAGQPLIALHSHELTAARSDYEKAKAALAQAEKARAYAHAEWERANRLLEAKAISRREQLRAAADLAAAEAELERARAEVRRAEEWLHHLGAWPEIGDEVLIRAPIDGIVLERRVTIGTVVTPSADLMTIADLSTLWVIAQVPEPQAALIRPGQPVWVTVAAFPGERFAGRVTYIGELLDPQTRTVQVRCLVRNRRERLRPEMYATITIALGMTEPRLVVPGQAIEEIGGESVVFVERGPGRFEKRTIRKGLSVWTPEGEWVEVTEGLRAGERIVVRGSFLLKSEVLKGVIVED